MIKGGLLFKKPLRFSPLSPPLFHQAFSHYKLSREDRTASGTPDSIMVQADETIIEDVAGP